MVAKIDGEAVDASSVSKLHCMDRIRTFEIVKRKNMSAPTQMTMQKNGNNTLGGGDDGSDGSCLAKIPGGRPGRHRSVPESSSLDRR